jgi:hypothetical protein
MNFILRASALIFFAFGFHALTNTEQPVVQSATMSVGDYSQREFSWSVSQLTPETAKYASTHPIHIDIHVPTLIIYDSAGKCVYYGTDAARNSLAVASLPQIVPQSDVPSGALSRDGMLSIVPEFSKRRATVVGDTYPTVFSLIAAGTGEQAAIQTSAIQSLRRRATAVKANILELSLAQ